MVLLFFPFVKHSDGKHVLPTSTALIIFKMGKYYQICFLFFQINVLAFILICADLITFYLV